MRPLVAPQQGTAASDLPYTAAGPGRRTSHGRSAAAGQATAHMDVDYKGRPCEISFNPDYLIDGLKNCELEQVRLEFTERTSPGKFTLGESYTYVVMPITIDA